MVTESIADAWRLAEDALDWLRLHYGERRFYTERDVVWTVQAWLVKSARTRAPALTVQNDYGTEPGQYRALSVDIALVAPGEVPAVILEFKYEPSHRRTDIGKGKFPVTQWGGVVADAERVIRWVGERRAISGIAILIDEGASFAMRSTGLHPWPIAAIATGRWESWADYGEPGFNVHVHRVDVRASTLE